MVIYKYNLEPHTILELPVHSQVLKADVQNGIAVLWVLLADTDTLQKRLFRLYATGEQMEENPGKYIDTLQIGPYVFHVFES